MPHASTEAQRQYDRDRYQRRKAAEPGFWRSRDADYCKKVRAARKKNDPVKHKRLELLNSAKRRSIKYGIAFNLCLEDIQFVQFCPILGIELNWTSSKCSAESPSLDRIIPEKGYVSGNIHVVSHKANTIKNNATPEEAMTVAVWMENNVNN